jgi:hypothetical protein
MAFDVDGGLERALELTGNFLVTVGPFMMEKIPHIIGN